MQISQQIASVRAPMEEVKAERPVSVIDSRIVCQPYHLAHIERDVAKIINCVTPTKFSVRSICWVRKGIKPIIRESCADSLK